MGIVVNKYFQACNTPRLLVSSRSSWEKLPKELQLGSNKNHKWIHKLPRINGQIIIVPIERVNEALELMWTDVIEPEEIDQYIISEWN